MKIAILYIGIGEYIKLWNGFFNSMERYFLPSHEKHYFVFTDAEVIWGQEKDNVHIVYQEDLGWPYNTLLRFKFFISIEEELKKNDYVFFMNANICCVRTVVDEEFLPKGEELVVVQHPAYYNKVADQFTYDRNVVSQAYVPMGEGIHYVCGGVNGGKQQTYLRMIHCLYERTEKDLEKGIIALWHDESHLNRYIIDYPNYRLLSPSFCFQEGADEPFERVLVARNKRSYFAVNKIKTEEVFVDEMTRKAMSADRFEQQCNLLRRWIFCQQNKIGFETYFEKRGIKKIAVYGYANLGQLFLDDIRKTNIEVIYVIDKNACMITNEKYRISTSYNKELKVDAIIVTAVYSYYIILDALLQEANIPILSLENILFDMQKEKDI